ncbi:hypothetical protein REPUB_Repub13aG0135300 [Reevesia pubescens]
MGRLGFRPPQFSEELAWLPACLQRITDTSVDPRSPSHRQFKELSCIQGEDSELLSRKESQRFRLFLSGEDNSPISSFPSSKDVLHFRLHLSSDGNSQYYQSQLINTFSAHHGSDKVLQLPQVEISAGSAEKTNQIKTNNSAGGVNALPVTSIPRVVENVGSQSSNHVKDSCERSVEKVTVRNLKSTDIKDAVELSIAASEALVIHELVKSESASEALPTAAVLEAALQVKQARLESSEDTFDCSTEISDEMDYLADLDDLTMADAFEDVGLSFSVFDDQHACGLDVSLVKDTPVSENCFGSGNRTEDAEQFSPQNKPSNDLTSGLKNSGFASNSDPMLYKLVQEISHVSETVQRVGFSMVDASVQPQAGLCCSDLWNIKNARESNAIPFVADGFRSRWFGGWTGKEADPVQLKPKTKNIPKRFVAETSFFSESADFAPDENSFVLKCEKNRSRIASDQSVLFEGLSDEVGEGIMVSQDVRSSNLSLVDPLCSIVPCSISSENGGSTLGQKGNSGEATPGNCFGFSAEHQNENMYVESIYETRQALPTVGGEFSAAKGVRQLTSLKAYSKVLHEHDSVLGSERVCLNQSTSLDLGDNNNGIGFSDNRNFEMSLAVSSIPDCAVGWDTEENKHTTVVDNPDGETTNDKKNYDKHAKDGVKLQDQLSKGRSAPLILPQRMRQRLQAARPLDYSSLRKANAEQAVAQDVSVALNSGSNPRWIQSDCNNPFDMQVPSRKRVHFSEIEVDLQQNKDLNKRQYVHQKSSTSRPSKRFKSDAQIRDSKRFSTIPFRDQKGLIFQNIQFLLTGFSSGREKEIEGLIWKYGGIVLVDIPSPSNRGKRCSRHKFEQLPILLCPKKLQTTKFLYACALNLLILKDKWLTDSIAAGSATSPGKYMVLSNQPDIRFTRIGKPVCHNNAYIFEGVGIMLHGKHHFCTKFAKVIQHGGGRVFKTLMWLVQNLDSEKISLAVIVSENENRASRHLRHCALERKIPMMPSSWLVRSLYSGKLLPFIEKKHTTLHAVMGPDFPVSDNWSQEI